MKRTYRVTIETDDENIAKKYPNWRFSFDSPDEFIDFVAPMDEDHWDASGYRITVNTQ